MPANFLLIKVSLNSFASSTGLNKTCRQFQGTFVSLPLMALPITTITQLIYTDINTLSMLTL